MIIYNTIRKIVKRKINSVSKLKKIGIPIDLFGGIDIHEIVELENDKEKFGYKAIPVSYQVTMYNFNNTRPKTFNYNSSVIVIIENKQIFFIPYNEKVISIIVSDNYIYDSDIYVPRLLYGAESFVLNAYIIQWKVSLFIVECL